MFKKLLNVFAFVLIALLIYFSDPAKILSILKGANLVLLAPALAIIIFMLYLKVIRWKFFLDSLNIRVSFSNLTKSVLASLFIANFTPARVGEPVRAYFLKKLEGSPISKTAPTIIIERVIDIIALIVLSLSGLLLFKGVLSGVSSYILWGSGLLLIFISIALFVLMKKPLLTGFLTLFHRIFSFIPKIKELGSKLENFSENFNRSFKQISRKSLLLVSAVTLLTWVLQGLICWFAFLSLGISLPLMFLISIAAIGTIIGTISSLPGGIGSMDAVMVLLLASFINVPEATAGILLFRLCSYVVPMAICYVYFVKISKTC